MAGNCFCTMVGAVGVALIGFFWYGMMIDSSQITSIETQIKEKLPAHFQDFTSFVNYTVSELGDFQTVSTELQKMIDATVGEDCDTFKCPENEEMRENPNHSPSSNGCGAFGVQWKKELMPHPDLEECCNYHDFCYDECGADKDLCDLHFKKCLYNVCKKSGMKVTDLQARACNGAAKFMYISTITAGCKAYQDAQNSACMCVKD